MNGFQWKQILRIKNKVDSLEPTSRKYTSWEKKFIRSLYDSGCDAVLTDKQNTALNGLTGIR